MTVRAEKDMIKERLNQKWVAKGRSRRGDEILADMEMRNDARLKK